MGSNNAIKQAILMSNIVLRPLCGRMTQNAKDFSTVCKICAHEPSFVRVCFLVIFIGNPFVFRVISCVGAATPYVMFLFIVFLSHRRDGGTLEAPCIDLCWYPSFAIIEFDISKVTFRFRKNISHEKKI